MEKVTVFHNPRCSKSRAVLALLEENDISPEIVYYLETPLDSEALEEVLQKLGMHVRDVLRRSEPEFEALGLEDESLADEIVLDLLVKHPILLQRPIVIVGSHAIIGRPPENVLRFIEEV